MPITVMWRGANSYSTILLILALKLSNFFHHGALTPAKIFILPQRLLNFFCNGGLAALASDKLRSYTKSQADSFAMQL